MTPYSSTPTDHPADPVLISTDAGVRTLTLHRPKSFNALNDAMKGPLLAAVRSAAEDDAVRVLVITGSLPAFCAGQDLKEHMAKIQSDDPSVADTVTGFYSPLISTITTMPKPVVAAVGGVAAGAGAALAFACDLRLASTQASFSMAFAQAGLAADSGASYTLPRLVGTGRAMRMMLLGEKVDAEQARQLGLVDELVDVEVFDDRCAAVAAQLAAGPTEAYGWIKRSVRYGEHHTLSEVLEFENRAQQACFASPNHHEALEAFAAKRPPRFHHVS